MHVPILVPIFSAHACLNGAGTVPWNGCKTVTILGFYSVNAVLVMPMF